ncbi:tyrosine-type recombinase/integrase [Otariodibacter oris]|uniref:Integrase n=1 Tax=Otariodibacter oris TaxID=1032623 RepID=A0A420XIQ7_9PAST|nr:integrase arm-type DNA-binding domain-containing protein [Otariodibacter oris]QGM80721.1 preprotein translocase [Otariodibacter oris]RKR77116.1 integrase [Otariodibacter oris]
MPKQTKPLTNTEVDKAKPKEKDYSLVDGQGLFLRVKTNGSKYWLFNYIKPITKKRTNMGIGIYPDVTLAQARAKRQEYRSLLAQGIDPQIHQKEKEIEHLQNQSNTLYKIAENWKKVRSAGIEALTMEKNWARLEKHLFSRIGDYPVTSITPVILIEALKPLAEEGKSDTLHRIIRLTNQILNYAVNIGVMQFNYCEKVNQAFSKKPKQKNPAIHPKELPEFLTTLNNSNRDMITKILIQWELLTMVRPAEAVSIEWSEIDWKQSLWNIPAEKMKKTKKGANPHTVPLSTQAIAILQKMKVISGNKKFVFPHYSKPNQSMSKETANSAIRKMGYAGKQTAHGLRAIARTYLAEQGVSYEVAEACLAHAVGSEVSLAYMRSTYLEQRKPVMQMWGDYVEQCSIHSTLATPTK